MKRTLTSGLAVVAVLLLSASVATACVKDTDCKGDRICVEGACQSPQGASTAAPSTPALMPAPAAAAGKRRNFHLNLLGLLQFGVTPSLEFGDDTTVVVRARLMNTGVMSYVMAGWEDQDFNFGLGLGAQVRRYLAGQGAAVGPYMGAGVELMSTESEDSKKAYKTKFLVPQIEGGFRWDYGTWLLGVGAYFGAAIPVDANYDDTETIVAAGLIVDMGTYF